MRSEQIMLLAGLALLAACAPASPPAAAAPAPGRVDVATFKATGAPRRCIPLRNTQLTGAGDNHAMARSGANRWWRNELRTRCPAMSRNHTIVLRTTTGQMCDMDMFEIIDPVSRMSFGSCSLGMFTPVEVPRGASW